MKSIDSNMNYKTPECINYKTPECINYKTPECINYKTPECINSKPQTVRISLTLSNITFQQGV
jgi:hypothetical protein